MTRVCNVPVALQYFFDKVVRLVNERAMGREVILRDGNGEGWEI